MGFTKETQYFPELQLVTSDVYKELSKKRYDTSEFAMEKLYREEVKKVTFGNSILFVKKAIYNLFHLWYVPARYMNDDSFDIKYLRKFYVLLIGILSLISLIVLFYNKELIIPVSYIIVFFLFSIPYMIGQAGNIRFKLDFEWIQFSLIALGIRSYKIKIPLILNIFMLN